MTYTTLRILIVLIIESSGAFTYAVYSYLLQKKDLWKAV